MNRSANSLTTKTCWESSRKDSGVVNRPNVIYFIMKDKNGNGIKINPFSGNSMCISQAEYETLVESGQAQVVVSPGMGCAVTLSVTLNVPDTSKDFIFLRAINQTKQDVRFSELSRSSWYHSDFLHASRMSTSVSIDHSNSKVASDHIEVQFDNMENSLFGPIGEYGQERVLTQPVKLWKSSIASLTLLGVFARSFLICSCNYVDAAVQDTKLLIIVDQHALHERVRLENLAACYFGSTNCSLSTRMVPVIILHFSITQITQLYECSNACLAFGLKFDAFNLPDETVSVSHVPSILTDRHPSLNDRESLRTDLHILLEELLEIFQHASANSRIIPPILRNLLAITACRGAIKFGDAIPAAQLTRLFKDAACVDMPFQCAHGRPSMIPVLNLVKQKDTPRRQISWRKFLRRTDAVLL